MQMPPRPLQPLTTQLELLVGVAIGGFLVLPGVYGPGGWWRAFLVIGSAWGLTSMALEVPTGRWVRLTADRRRRLRISAHVLASAPMLVGVRRWDELVREDPAPTNDDSHTLQPPAPSRRSWRRAMLWSLATFPWAVLVQRVLWWSGSWSQTLMLAVLYTLIVGSGTAAALVLQGRRARNQASS